MEKILKALDNGDSVDLTKDETAEFVQGVKKILDKSKRRRHVDPPGPEVPKAVQG